MTRIYENLEGDLQRPDPGQWCRIKTGLYAGDLGIVLKDTNYEDRIFVKLVPRLDPSNWLPKDKAQPKKFTFQRSAQMAFDKD